MNVNLSQIVYSKAGRDTGRKFLVVGIIDEDHVLISDGKLRKIEKPKKKKIRHLKITTDSMESMKEKLENQIIVTNSEVRKALKSFEIKHESVQ